MSGERDTGSPEPLVFGTKPGHHAVTSFTKPGPAILT
jgi:hypothetical protein